MKFIITVFLLCAVVCLADSQVPSKERLFLNALEERSLEAEAVKSAQTPEELAEAQHKFRQRFFDRELAVTYPKASKNPPYPDSVLGGRWAAAAKARKENGLTPEVMNTIQSLHAELEESL